MNFLRNTVPVLVGIICFIAVVYLFPWKKIEWGRFALDQPHVITVVGESRIPHSTQIASFTAGVSVTNRDRDQAINQVNEKINSIIKEVKSFGVDENDIKTQNISVYQKQETFYDQEGRPQTRAGEWVVSNQVVIKLRDINEAGRLAELLAKSGATDVYGPSFSLGENKELENQLIDEAIADAREKAELIAKSSGRKLGRIINVSEEGVSSPLFGVRFEGGGGGMPIEPGTEEVIKRLVVTFQLE